MHSALARGNARLILTLCRSVRVPPRFAEPLTSRNCFGTGLSVRPAPACPLTVVVNVSSSVNVSKAPSWAAIFKNDVTARAKPIEPVIG